MHILFLAVAIIVFAALAVAVERHFQSDKMPSGMVLISLLSLVNMATLVWSVLTGPPSPAYLAAGLGITLIALALFVSAITASRRAALRLAFDPSPPSTVLREGPYRWVRHPFYASYSLFWLGCALGSLSATCALLGGVLIVFYVKAARDEESAFRASPFADDYANYARATGMLCPKLKPAP